MADLLKAEPQSTFYACDVRGIGESRPDTCGANQFLTPYGSDRVTYAGVAAGATWLSRVLRPRDGGRFMCSPRCSMSRRADYAEAGRHGAAGVASATALSFDKPFS